MSGFAAILAREALARRGQPRWPAPRSGRHPGGLTSSDARQRIVEAAERLFYAEGVRAVGIDRIIAEADVAKMSLYNHFPSKDDVILAVLRHRAASSQDRRTRSQAHGL